MILVAVWAGSRAGAVVPMQALLPCQSASSPIQYANEPFLLLPRKERLTRPQWRGVQSKLLSVGAVPQWEAALKAAVPRPTSSQPHKVHKLQKCRAQVALLVTDRIQSPSKNQNLNATRQASLLVSGYTARTLWRVLQQVAAAHFRGQNGSKKVEGCTPHTACAYSYTQARSHCICQDNSSCPPHRTLLSKLSLKSSLQNSQGGKSSSTAVIVEGGCWFRLQLLRTCHSQHWLSTVRAHTGALRPSLRSHLSTFLPAANTT
mmetsp:Transcript_48769/g.78596  ORF Transcript_48769/g.78596 Transcript_48769/m.78596 type:complete len:261 (-) Transcript_48769:26-808(-)